MEGRPLTAWPTRLEWVTGLLDAAGTALYFLGLERLGPVPVALLGALAPVAGGALAWLGLSERLTLREAGLAVASVAGALLFTWRGATPADGLGLALVALSTLCYAASNLHARLALLRGRSPEAVAAASKLAALAPRQRAPVCAVSTLLYPSGCLAVPSTSTSSPSSSAPLPRC